jgi:peptide/nickel transport system substrate-binding protein
MYQKVFLGLMLLVLLAACGGTPVPTQVPDVEPPPVDEPAPTSPPEEDEPVVLRVGWLTPIDSWNPHVSESYWQWGDLVFDFWLAKGSDPNCTPEARLVETWELSPDGSMVTIKLAERATFSDGTPADARNVADYMEYFAGNPDLAPWFATMLFLDTVEVVDELTLQITTVEPVVRSFVTNDGIFMSLQSMDVWGDVVGVEAYMIEAYPPLGTGPYALKEYEPGSYAIFEARPEYHRGTPPIDTVVQVFYSNVEALVSGLLAGEIDLTPPRMPAETYDTLMAASNLTVEERVATDKYNLNFNMNEFGVRHPAIADQAVRDAIDFAIDRQQVLDVALLGHGALCPTNFACAPNMVDQINPDLTVTPYDPAQAVQILEDAGYLDTDGDGVRETSDGQPLEFRLFFELEDPVQVTITDLITDNLNSIGIAIEPQALEHGEMSQGVLSERDFDMLLYNMYTDAFGPGGMDYSGSCWAADAGASGRNYPGYCNEEVDNLVYESWYTLDEDVFYDSLFEAQAIIAREKPYITIVGVNKIQAFNNEKFEFPFGICHELEGGMFSYMGVMNAEVK